MEDLVRQGREFDVYDLNDIITNRKLDTDKISDGYHTFGELYEARYLLWINTCLGLNGVYKTMLDHEKKPCDGWFILFANTPLGQISFHLPMRLWDVCARFKEMDYNRYYDGHNTKDVLERLLQLIIH